MYCLFALYNSDKIHYSLIKKPRYQPLNMVCDDSAHEPGTMCCMCGKISVDQSITVKHIRTFDNFCSAIAMQDTLMLDSIIGKSGQPIDFSLSDDIIVMINDHKIIGSPGYWSIRANEYFDLRRVINIRLCTDYELLKLKYVRKIIISNVQLSTTLHLFRHAVCTLLDHYNDQIDLLIRSLVYDWKRIIDVYINNSWHSNWMQMAKLIIINEWLSDDTIKEVAIGDKNSRNGIFWKTVMDRISESE
jgi:hypothetical protein